MNYEQRKNMTFKQALEEHLFGVECCCSCGKEGVRLYYQTEGTYAGHRYCRSCAIRQLKDEYF